VILRIVPIMNLKKQLLLGCAFGALAAITPALAAPPTPPPPPAPVYNWTGWYVGGNIGYSWGHGAVTYNEPAFGGFGLPTSFSGSNHLDGAIGGGQIGYNWQLNNSWVAGLEADLQLSDERGIRSFSNPYSFVCDTEGATCPGVLSGTLRSQIDWFGTARARLGWLFNPTTMVYGTGGLAYGRVSASGSFTDTGCTPTCTWSFSEAKTNIGLALGAGIEGVIPNTTNWTWKVEYLYIDLGSLNGSGFDTDFGGPYVWNARFTDNILRFGLNWHYH
jgi:outer membrane immunogenic protein